MSNPSGVKAGLNLRSNNWKSMPGTVPTGGCTGGAFVVIDNTLCMYMETRVSGDVGKQVALLYYAEKIVVPKKTGVTFNKGDKVYLDNSPLTNGGEGFATGYYLIGMSRYAYATGDTYMEIEFDGKLVV